MLVFRGVVVAIAVVCLALACGFAFAHEAPAGWAYSESCCSGIDCRQIDSKAIYEGPDGYTVPSGEVVGYGSPKLKDSPDGAFHWCSYQGLDTGKTICLYVPGKGS